MNTDKLPSCCAANGFADKPDGCKCGRLCPAGRFDIAAAWRRLRARFKPAPIKDQITLADVLDAPPFSPNLMMLATGICGLIGIAAVLGLAAFVIYTIVPIAVAVAASFN